MAVTNAVSWRSEGIRYRKNEVFLDVVESVNLLVSSIPTVRLTRQKLIRLANHQVNTNGNVVRSEILGAVKMKCYLSGMPELRLGLNDKVMFESTGRSTSSQPPYLVSLLTLPFPQRPEAKRSKWRTSNSINVSDYRDSRMTEPSLSSRRMVNSS